MRSAATPVALVATLDHATKTAPVDRLLQGIGFEVRKVCGAGQAFASVLAEAPAVTVLVADYPLGEAVETLAALRGALGDGPIMIVTAAVDAAGVVAALTAGADEVLVLPLDADMLAAKLSLLGDPRQDCRAPAVPRPMPPVTEPDRATRSRDPTRSRYNAGRR